MSMLQALENVPVQATAMRICVGVSFSYNSKFKMLVESVPKIETPAEFVTVCYISDYICHKTQSFV